MRKRLIFCLLLCIFSVFIGCGHEAVTEGDYYIYYKNLDHTGISYYRYDSPETETNRLIADLWEQTCKKPQMIERESVVPSDVVLLKSTVDGNNLSIYFNTAVKNMDIVAELLFRAALVKTFTMIEGIETVTFFVDDKPMTDAGYAPLGAQKASSYVDIIGSGLSGVQKTTLTLYYTEETGTELIKSTKDIVYENSYSLERHVIDRLKEGNTVEGYYPTLPSSLQVISINVKSGTCYVNFDSSFITDALPISGYAIIYSVVNSLSELAEVKRVQIMVNGDSNVTFKENISLVVPLERNLDYVGGL